jgi:CRP/FNR family cyclic AMP-dependent transcriptional regulator
MAAFVCTATTLKALPFFSSLDDATLCAALPRLSVRTYPTRASIAISGNTFDNLYVIVSGRVRVIQHDEHGREAIVDELCPPEFFNETGWLEGRPDDNQIYVAGAPCTILLAPRRLLEELLRRDATLSQAMLQSLTDRLDRAHRKIARLAFDSVYARVVDVLLERGHEEGGEWRVDVGPEFIARLVGASREMVSRVVADLMKRGLVQRAKRQIVVTDRATLDMFAKEDRTSLRLQARAAMPMPGLCAAGEELAA